MKKLLALLVLVGAMSPCFATENGVQDNDDSNEVEKLIEKAVTELDVRCPGVDDCDCDEDKDVENVE